MSTVTPSAASACMMSMTWGSANATSWKSGCSLTARIPLSRNEATFSSGDSPGCTVPAGMSRSRGIWPIHSLVRNTVEALLATARAIDRSIPAASIVVSSPVSVPSKWLSSPDGRVARTTAAMWSGHT